MTLKTWKAEFYPNRPTKRMTKIEAIEHSLRKWKGLTAENMYRHQVEIIGDRELVNMADIKGVLSISNTSCALCKLYFDFAKCEKCPLAQSLGNRCDDREKNAPYQIFLRSENPFPMITSLEKTLEMVKDEEK